MSHTTDVAAEGQRVGPLPPLDGQVAAALANLAALGTGSNSPTTMAQRRVRALRVLQLEDLTAGGAVESRDITVPGPAGAPDLTMLVARPANAQRGAALPLVYFVHGGGMTVGDRRLGFSVVAEWCARLGLVATSVEYRLAPEHPYPEPVEDCYAGLRWVFEHATELGGDPERIVIAGSSAGGGLTASLAHLARDRGGPAPIGQVLMCPMLDDRNNLPSTLQMSGPGIWNREANGQGWAALLGDRVGGPDVPAAAAGRATDLTGLPPAFLDVGSAETMRDEAVAYASAIWAAGGQAELHVWPGGFHGFDLLAPDTAISRNAREARIDWLRRLLGL
ncbi:Esterase [Frankia canadensis]|uniref:Esterase n=1 Tax=Frankia canadensis TaxID=1836972 RepID=A0A2I2KXB0_9ACTN|nr:alpha/beta hydrolase [Frankia canadensis]SNQ50303.1 Esterase [Frankia canadensis]SOU57593.1 Esterase [Frankia canadensis]